MLENYFVEYEWHRRLRRKRPVYMMVTTDKYSLPLAIADSVGELAKIVGVSPETISHELESKKKYPRYVEVWIDKRGG